MDVCFHVSATMLILGKEHGPTSVGREKKKKVREEKRNKAEKLEGRMDATSEYIFTDFRVE